MKHPQLHSIEEIRKSHGSIRNVNALNKENLSAINKIALWITNHVGSMGFFYIQYDSDLSYALNPDWAKFAGKILRNSCGGRFFDK